MYRLVLYCLIFLVVGASVLGFLGILGFSGISILTSALLLVAACVVSNKILAFIFRAPANIESAYITALILALIITPSTNLEDFYFLLAAAVTAMGGKYILFWKHKHIFNPAATAVVTTAIIFGWHASWWVGNSLMFPFLLLGILIVKKIERFSMVASFFIASTIVMLSSSLLSGQSNVVLLLQNALLHSPILFFAFIMFVEPQTSPTRKMFQIIYGVIVGVLYSSNLSLAVFYISPEIALMGGNLFSYLVGMRQRVALKLQKKINIGLNIVEFIFRKPAGFTFEAGQYLEWTLVHNGVDSRGNRRFFTIAASPTESTVRLGVRLSEQGSSFKRALMNLNQSQTIVAGSLSGDFVLPKDGSEKLVFIAGGIGITPFRAIVKYLIDKNEKRDIALFYANKTKEEVAYKEIFDTAAKKFGLKTIYIFGRMSSDDIKRSVPDYALRTFYLSGSHAMVEAYKKMILKEMHVASSKIVTDYFPGYA